MSGLFGFSSQRLDLHASAKKLSRMGDLLDNPPFLQQDSSYVSEMICASGFFSSSCYEKKQPLIVRNTSFLWFDGELYNIRDNSPYKYPASTSQSDAEWFLQQFNDFPNHLDFLRQLDGIFTAVVYDSKHSKIHLISDRFGLSRLYWSVRNHELVWSAELKGMLAFPTHSLIDNDAVEEFLGIGFFVGNKTWFCDANLLPASTILTWDIRDCSLQEIRYWNWEDSRLSLNHHSLRNIADDLGSSFTTAVEQRCVEQRCNNNQRLGLHLSGGRDSRAILAALPDLKKDEFHAITFGSFECDDIMIAQRVAQLKGVKNTIFEIKEENWLEPRFCGVWQSDGCVEIQHMHAFPFLKNIKELFDINLTGAGGDGIFGGGHLFSGGDIEIYMKKLELDFSRHAAAVQRFKQYFDALGNSHALYVEHRIRRFSLNSVQLAKRAGIKWRFPFLDNALQELLYSIPIERRQSGEIYNAMLLQSFPEFFRDVPWQSTGFPISANPLRIKVSGLVRRKPVSGFIKALGIGKYFPSPKGFAAYSEWIRVKSNWCYFEGLLRNRGALIQEYVDSTDLEAALDAHAQGANRSNELCRYLTLEIWLRHLKNGSQISAEELRETAKIR